MRVSRAQLDRYIERQIRNPQGKARIGQSMIEPIRRGRDYVGTIRKCLWVDKLPTGAPMWYDKDPDVTATLLSKRGGPVYQQIEGTRLTPTPYAIVAYVRIPVLEVAVRRFNILDREQVRARAEMAAAEDVEGFRAFKAIHYTDTYQTPTDGTATYASAQTVTYNGTHAVSGPAGVGGAGGGIPSRNDIVTGTGTSKTISRDMLSQGFANIEQWDAPVANVLMHASAYRSFRTWTNADFDPVTQRELIKTGYVGDIWNAQVRVSRKMEKRSIFCLAEQDFLGVHSVRLDLDQMDAQDPDNLLLGWVFYEYVASVVGNNLGVSMIVLDA